MLDYKNYNIRDEAILTGSYAEGIILGAEASNPTKVHTYSQMVVNVSFTIGNLTNAQVKIEFSPNNVKYYNETSGSVDGSVSTDVLIVHRLETSGNYAIPVPITTRYVKISAIGNGDATDSLMSINADLGVN